jgi:phage tail sheath gpL-like
MAALGEELVSRIVGYKITKGDFRTSSPNLPQRVVILGEANTANQAGLSTDALTATTLQQIGNAYGYGSPIYHTMRILRPMSGGGIGGIPIVVLAQAAAGGSVAKVMTIEPSGTATANGTHTIYVAGRAGIDGQSYDINIESGDDVSDITAKIETAINNVLGAPVIASEDSYEVTLTAKWTGLTSNDLTVSIELNIPLSSFRFLLSFQNRAQFFLELIYL